MNPPSVLHLTEYPCPLCHNSHTELWHQDAKRPYIHCNQCDLIHVPAAFHLSAEDEKQVYDQHENNPDDLGYRKFLSKAYGPVQQHIPPASAGIDFGCGPGPTLSLMAQEDGHQCAVYDPYFAPDRSTLIPGHYDFVTCTEVIEHVSDPVSVLNTLFGLMKPGACLVIMTKRHNSAQDNATRDSFARWHYILDPTHITFFSEKTFLKIAEIHNAQVSFPATDVAFFTLPPAAF